MVVMISIIISRQQQLRWRWRRHLINFPAIMIIIVIINILVVAVVILYVGALIKVNVFLGGGVYSSLNMERL